jgi:hypothetical protein
VVVEREERKVTHTIVTDEKERMSRPIKYVYAVLNVSKRKFHVIRSTDENSLKTFEIVSTHKNYSSAFLEVARNHGKEF